MDSESKMGEMLEEVLANDNKTIENFSDSENDGKRKKSFSDSESESVSKRKKRNKTQTKLKNLHGYKIEDTFNKEAKSVNPGVSMQSNAYDKVFSRINALKKNVVFTRAELHQLLLVIYKYYTHSCVNALFENCAFNIYFMKELIPKSFLEIEQVKESTESQFGKKKAVVESKKTINKKIDDYMTKYLDTDLKKYFDPKTRSKEINLILYYIQLTLGNLKAQIDSPDTFSEFQSIANLYYLQDIGEKNIINGKD